MPKRVERLLVEDCHRLNFTKDLYDHGMARLDRISLRMIRFKTTGTGVRWQPSELKAIDEWRDAQGRSLSRSEAIRRLVEIGLEAELPPRRRSPQAGSKASKASELAGEQVEKLLSPLLSERERQVRSRQLIRGPNEFRKMRKKQ